MGLLGNPHIIPNNYFFIKSFFLLIKLFFSNSLYSFSEVPSRKLIYLYEFISSLIDLTKRNELLKFPGGRNSGI